MITNQEVLNREKELIEVIKQLQAELSEAYNKQACNCCFNKKELRSQSIANTNEHLAFCQKATGTRLTVEELSQRKDCCQRHEHWRCSSSNSGRGIAGRMEAIAPQELTPEHSQHRLHSPIGNVHHRISPSHQLFFGKGSSPSSEKAEKRPAWKF
uniref:Uncharacterized protein n=1 Tax=Meloidogyne enterolobii TaxID=390850 RepID=A0A6V7XEJ6_MELEN|nr:unnamed protein product [Meloidogyne enterolobii]